MASSSVITMPVKVAHRAAKRADKLRLKALEEAHSHFPKGDRTKTPIISCRRSELNFYPGQRYSPFLKLPLATEHWASRRTIGDYFTISAHRSPTSTTWYRIRDDRLSRNPSRAALDEDDDDGAGRRKVCSGGKPSFEGIGGLGPDLTLALSRCGFTVPTNIQSLAIPELVRGQTSLIASETGNGKTLAFLAPLLERVRAQKSRLSEAQAASDVRLLHRNRPMGVVVAPGRELASQIYRVAVDICRASSRDGGGLGLTVRLALGGGLVGGSEETAQQQRVPVDVLIGTPGTMLQMFQERGMYPGSVSCLVLDEADTLLDDTFCQSTVKLISMLGRPDPSIAAAAADMFQETQVVLVGATMPSNFRLALGHLIDPDQIRVLQTKQVHRALAHICHKFIRAPKVNRPDYLMDLLPDDRRRRAQGKAKLDAQYVGGTLIFSNKSSTAQFLAHLLRDRGFQCGAFTSSVPWRQRAQNLREFLNGGLEVLSCTDLASRGIDTPQVKHVVNYDFPSNLSDYLHRAGRVGRVGSVGGSKVTSLVCGQVSISLVMDIERSVRLGKDVPNFNSNISDIIKTRHEADQPHQMELE